MPFCLPEIPSGAVFVRHFSEWRTVDLRLFAVVKSPQANLDRSTTFQLGMSSISNVPFPTPGIQMPFGMPSRSYFFNYQRSIQQTIQDSGPIG